jgi:Haloacid dehalogenase-like hydrolase
MLRRASGFANREAVLFQWDGTLVAPRPAQPFPWARGLIGALRGAGRAVGVVTAKPRRRFRCEATIYGIGDLIDVAVCADDVTHGAPDPQPVLVAIAAWPFAADGWVVVSDRCADIVSASVAGVGALGAAWGSDSEMALLAAGATRVVASASDLAWELGADRRSDSDDSQDHSVIPRLRRISHGDQFSPDGIEVVNGNSSVLDQPATHPAVAGVDVIEEVPHVRRIGIHRPRR